MIQVANAMQRYVCLESFHSLAGVPGGETITNRQYNA